MFCKQEIRMDQINGKWGAYNINGGFHQCRPIAQTQTETGTKKAVTKPFSIEERLVRLERIVLDPRK